MAQGEVFPIEKEERLILADGAADLGSILVLRESGSRLAKFVAKESIGIENFVAQVLVSGAVKRIVSGSGDQGYDPARGVSKFGTEIVGQKANS